MRLAGDGSKMQESPATGHSVNVYILRIANASHAFEVCAITIVKCFANYSM